MITLIANDITINIVKNNSCSSTERDFELLVDYVGALKDICDDINCRITKVS